MRNVDRWFQESVYFSIWTCRNHNWVLFFSTISQIKTRSFFRGWAFCMHALHYVVDLCCLVWLKHLHQVNWSLSDLHLVAHVSTSILDNAHACIHIIYIHIIIYFVVFIGRLFVATTWRLCRAKGKSDESEEEDDDDDVEDGSGRCWDMLEFVIDSSKKHMEFHQWCFAGITNTPLVKWIQMISSFFCKGLWLVFTSTIWESERVSNDATLHWALPIEQEGHGIELDTPIPTSSPKGIYPATQLHWEIQWMICCQWSFLLSHKRTCFFVWIYDIYNRVHVISMVFGSLWKIDLVTFYHINVENQRRNFLPKKWNSTGKPLLEISILNRLLCRQHIRWFKKKYKFEPSRPLH